MKKRLLTLAAALCLGLVLMTGTALADGTAVEDVKVEADGVTVAALADENTDCTLIAALYDKDGRMVDVKSQTIQAGKDWKGELTWAAQQAGADKVKVFLVDSRTSEPVSRSSELPVPREGEESPAAGLDFAVVLGTDWGPFGTRAKLLLADGSKKVVDLDSNYDNVNNLMIGELYTFRTNADGAYQLDPAPMDGASSGYDYTGLNATVQAQSDTNGNAGYIDGYEIADDTVVFVQCNGDYSYKAITGTNLCAMTAGDFTCSYVLATDSETGAGKVNLAYVTTNRNEIVSGSQENTLTASGYAVLLGTDRGAFSDQAKLLFADGSKKVVDLDSAAYGKDGCISFYDLIYGSIYVYEARSDGSYQLKAAPLNSASAGYDYVGQNAPVQAQSAASAKAGYIDGYQIADDAVIFVSYDFNSSYKVISGKDLRALNAADVTCSYVLGTDNAETGAGAVNMAYVATPLNEVTGGDSGQEAPVTDQGYAVLIAWSSGSLSDQAKLLFGDGSKKVVDLDRSVYYQDGYVSAYDLRTEQIYSCEVTGDGEYRLKELTGYDKIQSYSAIQAQSDTNANAGYIDGCEIADDAVIFLQYGPSSYKVITGTELRTMDSKELSAMYYAANEKVSLAFVAKGGGGGPSRPPVRTETLYYYIDNVQEDESDNGALYHFYGNMGGGLDDYRVEAGVWPGLEKGSVVAVEVNKADRSVREIRKYVTPDDMVAITEVNGDALTIDGSGTYFLARDAGIVAVDFDKKESVDSLGWDQYVDSGITVAKTSDDGAYIPNAMVLFNDEGEIAFIAYDCEKID